MQLWTVFWRVYNVTCQTVLWNWTFLYIYLTMFFGVRKFKNTFKLWRSSLFWKCSNVNINLENAKKKRKKKKTENIFRFWDNWIWKRCYKLSLLSRKYLMGWETVLRIFISLSATLSTIVVFTGINKYGKGAVIQISTVFWSVYHVTFRRVLWNLTF